MPTARVADALRSLARDSESSDGELVRRFADHRDEEAFAELIRRHGPTVLGVCRRVLGHAQDAEDAFQAVWLVFARRAADVQPPGSVGNFLYGVAVRTATKARTLAAKRRQRQMAAAKPEPVADVPADSDLRAVLDEELARLPDKLRAAVVLCDLNGKSRSIAAAELGWPEGTVAARQAKGRELLASRLRRRGIALALPIAAVLAPEATAASVPAELASSALAGAIGGAAVSPSAQLLAEGVMRSMSAARWKLPAILVLTLGVAGGAVWAARPAPAPEGQPPQPREKLVVPVVKAAKPWKEGELIQLAGWLPGSVAYSPDGKTLLVGGTGGHVTAFDAAAHKELWKHTDESGHFAAVAFSRGTTPEKDGELVAMTFKNGVHLLDAKSGKLTQTQTEEGSEPIAVGLFPDRPVDADKAVVVRRLVFGNARGYVSRSWVIGASAGSIKTSTVPDGKEPADRFAVPLALDLRGRAETHAVMTGPIVQDTGKNVLWAYSCGTGVNHVLEGHRAIVTAAAWSADGTTIVTGDADGVVIAWDAATFKEKSRLFFGQRVAAVAVNADGSRMAAAVIKSLSRLGPGGTVYYETVRVWETKEKAEPVVVTTEDKLQDGPFNGLASLAFSPDGKELAAGFANFDHLTKSGELRGIVRTWRFTAK